MVPECPILVGVTLNLTSGTSHIIGGSNPKFSVWIHLGVVESHTLFKDHCLIYENLLSLGYFINL